MRKRLKSLMIIRQPVIVIKILALKFYKHPKPLGGRKFLTIYCIPDHDNRKVNPLRHVSFITDRLAIFIVASLSPCAPCWWGRQLIFQLAGPQIVRQLLRAEDGGGEQGRDNLPTAVPVFHYTAIFLPFQLRRAGLSFSFHEFPTATTIILQQQQWSFSLGMAATHHVASGRCAAIGMKPLFLVSRTNSLATL